MKKNIIISLQLLLVGIILTTVFGCKKDDNFEVGIPVLTTSEITDITQTTAKSGGIITSDGGASIIARGLCWSSEHTPTILDEKTSESPAAGNFTSSLKGLNPGTTYNVRAYVTNSAGVGYGNTVSFKTEEALPSSFTDSRDNNVYQIITIGKQTWMAENLKYLPSVVEHVTGSETKPYYYVYDYSGKVVADAKKTENYTIYGVLYNWAAAMAGAKSSVTNPSKVQGVCPKGWHLPSRAEWTQLITNLNGVEVAGGKLKEVGLTHWTSPNANASNETGFTALPGGFRGQSGDCSYINNYGYWWCATENNENESWCFSLSYETSKVNSFEKNKEVGYSVRCVKD